MADDFKKWKKSLKPEWITSEITAETVNWAEGFGEYLADGLKRTNGNQPIQTTNKDGSLKFKDGKPVYEKQAALSTSQLRKFFGEIRRMQAEIQLSKVSSADKQKFDKTSLLMLKPKLAYQVGREKDRDAKIKDFYAELSDAVDKVNTRDEFNRFVKIVEAIVAYHKEKETREKDVQDLDQTL